MPFDIKDHATSPTTQFHPLPVVMKRGAPGVTPEFTFVNKTGAELKIVFHTNELNPSKFDLAPNASKEVQVVSSPVMGTTYVPYTITKTTLDGTSRTASRPFPVGPADRPDVEIQDP